MIWDWIQSQLSHSVRPTRRQRRVFRQRHHAFARAGRLLESLEERTQMAVVIDLDSLTSDRGIQLSSPIWQDMAGWSVSDAGDINRDGFDDVIVGAPVTDGFPAGTGQAYVVYGKVGAFTNISLPTLNGINGGFPLYGEVSEDHAGYSVSSAGDINGDGFHDFLVGSPAYDRVVSGGLLYGAGRGYLVFGGFTNFPSLSALNGTNGFAIQGLNLFDRAGFSVSSAGDVNGDGYDDLLIGAPIDTEQFPGVPGPGQAYLIYGKATGFSSVVNVWELTSNNAGFPFVGVSAGDLAGLSVSDVGDINGDGFADFAIGAPAADRPVTGGSLPGSGETYIVFGGFTNPPALNALNGLNGFKVAGFGAYERNGFSVSGAGDINGDGFDDLIVGSPADEDFPVNPGQAAIIFGKGTGFTSIVNVADLNGQNGFRLLGIDGLDHAGLSVSGGGDVNGDGYDDLIIGAPYADKVLSGSTLYGTGEAYVVFGRSTAFPAQLSLGLLSDTEGLLLRGNAEYDRAGWSVSHAGDVNGDGFDDLLIGAPVDTIYAARGGRAYLMFGRDFTNKGVTLGTPGNDTLSTASGPPRVLGGAANDQLTGIGTGIVLRGGQGDDTLLIRATDFLKVDGGRGEDTLRLEGASLNLNLANLPKGRLTGIERIDLSGPGNYQLTLGSARDVLNLSDTSNRLIVQRDSGDTVNIGTGWTSGALQTLDGRTYRTFRQGAAELWLENIAPVLDLNGSNGGGLNFSAVYTEDSAAVPIVDTDLLIIDEDNLTAATARITNLQDGVAESLAVTVGTSGIVATYDAPTGTLQLTGTRTRSAYESVLRTLRYANSSQNPSTTSRLVEVTVSDGILTSVPVTATVGVVQVNDAPILASSPTVELSFIDEDTLDPPGNTINQIIPLAALSDPDGVAVRALAVTGANNTNGIWQFAVAGGGWNNLGTPSVSTARLLGPTDRIRFVPNANFHGSATLTVRAWDQSSGTAGGIADTTLNGGSTAFSAAQVPATQFVQPVNDAPVLNPAATPVLTTIARDSQRSNGDLVGLVVVDGSIQDVDGSPIRSIAITALDETHGSWQYSINGLQWTTIQASEDASFLLGAGRRIRFVPQIGFFGTATFTFRAWDQSSGTEFTRVDTRSHGGITPYSSATNVATITVSEEDSSPTLDPISSPVLVPSTSPVTVPLSGITDGGAGIEVLTVTALSSNPAILPHPTVNYTSPDPGGSLSLTGIEGKSGWVQVTVTVTEADDDTVSRTFNVSVGPTPAWWQNPVNPRDVDNDGNVVPRDALILINELNSRRVSDSLGRLPVPPPAGSPPPFYDVNGNQYITSQDVLIIINFLNSRSSGEGEGEGSSYEGLDLTPAPAWEVAADEEQGVWLVSNGISTSAATLLTTRPAPPAGPGLGRHQTEIAPREQIFMMLGEERPVAKRLLSRLPATRQLDPLLASGPGELLDLAREVAEIWQAHHRSGRSS